MARGTDSGVGADKGSAQLGVVAHAPRPKL